MCACYAYMQLAITISSVIIIHVHNACIHAVDLWYIFEAHDLMLFY